MEQTDQLRRTWAARQGLGKKRLSGIEATRKIALGGRSRVLILSQHDSWSYVEAALKVLEPA